MSLSHRRLSLKYSLFPKHMRPMFYGTLLYSIADQMVGIFLPLFLFGVGQKLNLFSLFHANAFISGILFVIAYYALQRLVILVAAFPASRLTAKIGYVPSMILGTLFACGNYIGFYLAKSDPRFLVLSFLSGGINMILYWVAHDSLFAQEVRVRQVGRNVGAIAVLTKVLGIAIPAISGVIIMTYGYNTLFLLGLIFLFSSCVPFLFVPKVKVKSAPTLRQFLSWCKERRYQRFAFVQIGVYLDVIAVLFWPIYVMLLVGKIQRVGYLFSIALLISLVLTYLVGWLIDHRKGKRVFFMGGGLIAFSWLIRVNVRGVWSIVGAELMDKLGASVYSPCYDSFMCLRSKGKSVLASYVYKEFLLSIWSMILWVLVFILFLLPSPWTSIFTLGAVGIVFSLFMDA